MGGPGYSPIGSGSNTGCSAIGGIKQPDADLPGASAIWRPLETRRHNGTAEDFQVRTCQIFSPARSSITAQFYPQQLC